MSSKIQKKVNQQIKKARSAGMTPIDVLKMREVAKKEANKMREEAVEDAFVYMLAIPLNILVNNYWPKSAKERAPKFIDDVLSLFEAAEDGLVTKKELTDFLFDYSGVKIEDSLEQHKMKKE